MFREEEEIADAASPAILDERALQREGLGVWNQAKAANFDSPPGSQ